MQTKTIQYAAILGAGLGSRLQSRAKAKPLASILGETLLSHLSKRLQSCEINKISCALREELLTEDDKKHLPPNIDYIFVNTESSLHTLGALIQSLPAASAQESVFFTMADTILAIEDLKKFLQFCSALPAKECAVLATSFISDEKPLYVHVKQQYASAFNASPAPLVTSGIYFLNPKARALALEAISQGTHKMRNFLSFLLEQGVPVKVFEVAKTIDVDHPSDLDQAAAFLEKKL